MKKLDMTRVLPALALCGLIWACSDDPDPDKDGGPPITNLDKGSTSKEMMVKDDLATITPDSAAAFTVSCAGRMPCMACCPNEDEACSSACLAILTEEGKAQLEAMDSCRTVTCAEACSGTKEQCLECFNSQCMDQQLACDWGSNGTGTCGAAFECFNACPALVLDGSGTTESCPKEPGLDCIQQCYSAMSANSEGLFITMGQCMYAQCQTECYDADHATACAPCMETKCKTDFDACKGN